MQKIKKFISIFYVLFVLSAQAEGIKNHDMLLEKADSLYLQKQYTEAYDHYYALYEQHAFSVQMLLKMSYIQDGLGDYSLSLFFLEKAYAMTYDPYVQRRILAISEKKSLTGYKKTDAGYMGQRLYENLHKYYRILWVSFLSVFLLCMVYISYVRYVKSVHKSSVLSVTLSPWIVSVVSAACLLFLFYKNQLLPQKGIVHTHTMLKKEPSAAAVVLGSLATGHKISVIEASAVWTKVTYQDPVSQAYHEAYVRTQTLYFLTP